MIDNGLPLYTYYPDCDGDGFGRATMSATGCGATDHQCRGVWLRGVRGMVAVFGRLQRRTAVHISRCRRTLRRHRQQLRWHQWRGQRRRWTRRHMSSCARWRRILPAARRLPRRSRAVHPGVTQYFTTAACPTGVACAYTAVTPPSTSVAVFACIAAGTTCPSVCLPGNCPATLATPTWDYDCSGSGDRQPSASASCGPPMGQLTGPCLGSGVTYSGALVCGASVTTWNCPFAFFPPSCPVATTSTGPLPCR